MRRSPATPFLVAGAAAFAIAPGAASTKEHGGASHEARPARPQGVPRDVRAPVAGTSSVPTCVFDSAGRLWAAWVEGGHVLVSSSPDGGSSWARASVVNPLPTQVDANGEGRPKVAVGEAGELFVTFTEKLAAPYSGNVRFSRSVDAGRTFSPPITVNDDSSVTGHRFDTLVAGPGSRVTVAWLDRRDHDRARAGGRPYAGTALYTAVSLDGGASFLPNRKVVDHVCECCRVAGARDAAGNVFLHFRAVFGDRTRDHALVRLDAAGSSGPVRRSSFDGWQLDGCPHQGPAIAAGENGTLHLAWYTGEGQNGRGLFYARSRDGGSTVDAPFRIAAAEPRATRPAVHASGRVVTLAWIETAGGTSRALARRSADGGATWGEPRELGRTSDAADHPLLLEGPRGTYLSWFHDAGGLTVTPLEPWPGAAGEGASGGGRGDRSESSDARATRSPTAGVGPLRFHAAFEGLTL